MKLIFTFDEIHQIIREYVEDNMRIKFDQIEFDLIGDPDFCVLTQSKSENDK